MNRRTRLRLRSAAVAALAAVALVTIVAPTSSAHHGESHWAERAIVVRDETGFADYRRALQIAADRWNAAGVLRVGVTNGTGAGCQNPAKGEIVVCRHTFEGSTVGEARTWISQGHIIAASVLMDTRPRPFEHLVAIACHELGHAFGLGHREERSSCLTATIHSSDPDAHDFAELRRMHAHAEGGAPAPKPSAPTSTTTAPSNGGSPSTGASGGACQPSLFGVNCVVDASMRIVNMRG